MFGYEHVKEKDTWENRRKKLTVLKKENWKKNKKRVLGKRLRTYLDMNMDI